MKKVIFAVLAIGLFSHCVKTPSHEDFMTTVSYSFRGGADMEKLFDFTATYVDNEKKTLTESITSLPWERQIAVRPPFDAHLEITFRAKTSIVEQPAFDVGFAAAIDRPEESRAAAAPDTAEEETEQLRFAVNLPEGANAADITATICPLKYDKKFAFTFTVDDAYENAWSRIFPLIHGKWIDDIEFFHQGCTPTTGYLPSHTLSMSDGCGNERRFGFGVSIWPNWGNSYNPDGFMKERSTSVHNPYITWEELQTILDFGGSVYFHNVDERRWDKASPSAIAEGYAEDYQTVVERLDRHMKVLALPDGNQQYLDATAYFPQIEFTRSSRSRQPVYLNDGGSLKGVHASGGINTSDIAAKLEELDRQAAAENPYWVFLTVHRPQTDYMEMLTEIYNRYGKAGIDALWVASFDEIYEYQEWRHSARISRTVEGQTLLFEITLPRHPHFTFRELSFTVAGAPEGSTIVPRSDNIYGLNCAERDGGLLVNVNFDPRSRERAEKYTAKYEASASETDKDDAIYLLSLLRPELAAPFLARLEHAEQPVAIKKVAINGGNGITYRRDVSVSLETEGPVSRYRMGETADLSAVAWSPYLGEEIAYTLSSGYGTKRLRVEVAGDSQTSGIAEASIRYSDVPDSGTIDRQAAEVYRDRYDGHVLRIDKKISAK